MVEILKKSILFLFFSDAFVGNIFAQAVGDYRNKESIFPTVPVGNTNLYTWGQIGWWQVWNGTDWVNATVAPNAVTSAITITIRPRVQNTGLGEPVIDDFIFDTNTSVIINNPNANLVIKSGATLQVGVGDNNQGRNLTFNNITVEDGGQMIASTNTSTNRINRVTLNGNLIVSGTGKFIMSGGTAIGNVKFNTQSGYDNRPAEVPGFIDYGGPVTTLPLSLLSFTAKKELNSVTLTWTTADEKNTDKFDIERTSSNVNFITIGTVKSDNTIGNHFYSFYDKNVLAEDNYYRLKMIDLDGTFTYSNIEGVKSAVQIRIYPIPCNENLNVTYPTLLKNSIVSIYNSTGQKVKSVTLIANSNQTNIDVSNLARGNYVINIDENTLKFIKE